MDLSKETASNFSNQEKEKYNKEIKKNIDFINKRKEDILIHTINSTRKTLELLQQDTSVDKIYDDYLVQNIAEQFNDRFKVLPVIGDIIRALKLVPFS